MDVGRVVVVPMSRTFMACQICPVFKLRPLEGNIVQNGQGCLCRAQEMLGIYFHAMGTVHLYIYGMS